MSENDKDFLEQISNTLDQGLQNVDGDTLNRLRQARITATERTLGRHRHGARMLAGGALASVVIAVVLSLQTGQKPVNESMLEDMALLSTDVNLELYRDVDFYDWLAEKEQTGGV